MIIEYTSDISNLITNKADLVDGKVPAEQLPSYVDDVIEFNNLQAPDTQISIIVGNNSYKNQIRFINGSSTSSNRIGSEDKYPNMFVNFGENTSEDDWTTFEPEKGKIYINTTNNHSYRWSGSQLIDLDQSWSNDIKDLQENTVSIKSQTLTEAQQAQVWQNLGLDLVVLKFPKGVTSITLTDEEDAKLQLGAAVLVTADSTDTTSNIYNANNHIFTTVDSKNTSQPLYYSLALFSGLLYCSYDKVSKKFTYQGIIRLIDTGAVRFDRTTPLTSAQQEQAFKNLGWKVHVISESAIGSSDAVSDDEKEARLAATALLVQETGEMYIYGHNSSSAISDRRFYRFRNTKTLALLNVVTTTGLITQPLFVNICDENAVSFNIDQSSVSNDKKNKALGNIGIDFVRLPYSLLGTTLSDEMANVINNARGIILVDTPNDFILPTIYNKGRTTSTNAKFITIGEAKDVYYISYNKNTKALATVVHNYTDTGYVRYVQEQNLTNTEKDTVLSNIGLDFVHIDYSLLGTTLTDEMFAVLDNAKGIILVNLPSNYYNPFVFIKGNNTSKDCAFVGFAVGTTYCQIKLNKSTKVLSGVNAGLTYAGSVRYAEEQSLTDTQKQQARSNIGATSCYDEYKLAGGTKYTTEADFNAQLVKVMNMTVVE